MSPQHAEGWGTAEGLRSSMRNNTRATKSTNDFKSFLFRKEEVDNKEATKIFASVFYIYITFIH